TETVLARKGLVASAALAQWRSLYLQRHGERSTPFYLIPALWAIGLGGANELDTTYTEYLSPTFRVGMRVPMLYLRSTLGAARDSNEVLEDQFLDEPPSSTDAPETARTVTFTPEATQTRHYERRNHQAPPGMVMAYASGHSELFVRMALDADTYLIPFLGEKR